ncbi:cellulose biosynthesis cyclic di-GMP-binding regulatory protein BcsB [Acetobacter sp. TBRC 12305]|uniref:Cyclic di-GMP-binding protein n=1 Tax=Acetobacter garciniae TaxID=2817435 RepID=A0A939HR97_9PROT|nr:cellulose biosynthesis cyclic di-GMP-binding regulatory protein BcsB [Acetobacter garciniae]MBO1326176.1 cellulose biosynthesis cyclic di-GMP-binding regulatory protein BcsB [Acetobacter garciniae]MBX0345080.1 cellulose biosynthesis cyclic di-GMP-binding regulatory protein BcsB [Acetobacter garciniae]
MTNSPAAWSASAQESAPYEVPERPSAPLSPSDVSLNAPAGRAPATAPAAAVPGPSVPATGRPAAASPYGSSAAASPSGMPQPADLPPPAIPASDTMQAPPAPANPAPNAQPGTGYAPPGTYPAPAYSGQPYPAGAYPNGAYPGAGYPAAGQASQAPAMADTGLTQPEITRTLTLRDLGVPAPMTLRGFSPLQGLDIPIPADEVVTRAQIVLDGALSPSLLPEASSLTLTLNEQYVGTVQVDPKNSRFGPLVFDIDPIFFSRLNHLNFQFAGEYRRDCNDLHNGVLWARVSDLSKIIVTTVKLPPVRRLAHLPAPFFDKNMHDVLRVPFVFPHASGQGDLKAAGIVASWFGKLADFRGTSFPASAAFPATGNAVEIGENIPVDSNGTLPSGPTLFEAANPNDRWGTVLVITGRNQQDVEIAARVLAFSSDTLGDVPYRVVADVNLDPRKPYDAPAFVPTDRIVRFGDIAAETDLQRQGGAPLGISVPFRLPPDLFRWKQHSYPVKLNIRTPAAAAFEREGARFDVLINNAYVQSFPLFSDAIWKKAENHLPGLQSGAMTFNAVLPPWLLFGGRNQLDLSFNVLPIDRGACRRVNDDFIAEVDSGSTFDFRKSYHYTTLPDLAYFAGSAFPFSRMADYSQTAVVLPAQPDMGVTSAFLELMGFLGSSTQYPVTGIDIASSADLGGLSQSKDIILLSTIDQLGAAKSLLSRSAYEINGQSIRLGQKTLLDGLWYLFQEKDAAGQNNNAQPVLNAPIVNASLLVGGESPYTNHRSVVAILGDHPAQLQQMVASLRDRQLLPAVQGDLVIKNGAVLTNYRNANRYTVGSLPLWIRIEMALEAHLLLLALAGLAGTILLAYGTARWLRAHARHRLQRRLPGEDEPIDS